MNDLTKSDSLLEDRFKLKDQVDLNLLQFINLQIEKVNNETDLKKDVLVKISERLTDEDDPVNDLVLLKLLEILAKQDNDIALGIMDLMKSNSKGTNEPNIPPIDPNVIPRDSDLTKEDVSEVKDLLKTLERVKKSEF